MATGILKWDWLGKQKRAAEKARAVELQSLGVQNYLRLAVALAELGARKREVAARYKPKNRRA